MNAIRILKQDRSLITKVINELTEEKLLFIPEGFKNNILWNLGHIIVVQQILHYKLSSLEMYVSLELCDKLKTGTSPIGWDNPPDIDELKTLLLELPERLEEDYKSNRFQNFQEYTTSTGIKLLNIEDAISFNNYHEGVHTGIILSLKKLIV